MSRRAGSKPAPRSRIPLERYIVRGQRRRWISIVLSILVAAVIIFADRQGWLIQKTADWARYDGKTCAVVRVIDGDTLDVDIADIDASATRIRFWGIDTPETAKSREGKQADPFADAAHARTRELCEGNTIKLKLDSHQDRDRYGRLLAYIILPDGSMLNEVLLMEGLARYEDRFPHQHIERFELLERQARFERRGMWKK